MGADPLRNNDFSYNFPGDWDNQERCPFAAHTRKSNPRHDLLGLPLPIPTEPHRILRRGIPFGPEVSPEEAESGTTASDRGLIFVCYQSNVDSGFRFIQRSAFTSSCTINPQRA
ncbi:hypothetical protein C8Q77DRAFT_1114768 [Trametes polyzona]|nr:hypothetical protein C8Q77DRAFT_1114768 [Trametes polyzona]